MESISKDNLNNTENNSHIAYLKLEIDERLQVVKDVKKVKPNYFMVGNGTMNRNKIFGIDLLRELANASKAGQFLLLAIKDGIVYGNGYHPVVKVLGTTKYEKNLLSEGYRELFERDLVRRVKRSHYMINPNAFIPPDYESAIAIWDSLPAYISPVTED